MRQDTKKILLMLCAVSSKRTLLGLWADLKAASKVEFESELARAQVALAAATRDTGVPSPVPPPRARASRVDTPAGRIAHHLTAKVGLAEDQAVAALTARLREKGVDVAKIPSAGGVGLVPWIEVLLERVSGAVVMGASRSPEMDSYPHAFTA